MDENLDVIHFIRRLRLYGASLTILQTPIQRRVAFKFSERKTIDRNPLKNYGWNYFEAFNGNELLLLSLLRRYDFFRRREEM
jgi:hypothetical protein